MVVWSGQYRLDFINADFHRISRVSWRLQFFYSSNQPCHFSHHVFPRLGEKMVTDGQLFNDACIGLVHESELAIHHVCEELSHSLKEFFPSDASFMVFALGYLSCPDSLCHRASGSVTTSLLNTTGRETGGASIMRTWGVSIPHSSGIRRPVRGDELLGS